MSSGHSEGVSPGCLTGRIVAHPPEDLIADPPADDAVGHRKE
jgi:hypothetical protein